MQTIDLGTIAIGGEEQGAPERKAEQASAFVPSEQPAAEIIRETVTADTLFSQPAPAAEPCSECREEHREERPKERCEEPKPRHHHGRDEIHFEKCEDYKHCHLDDSSIEGQGRILDLSLCLKNVCPGKRVAVGVLLYEIDSHGHEYPRGLKTFTVAAHRHNCCADIPVETVRFILPEDVGVGTAGDSCGCRRHFIAKVAAHYMDFNSTGAAM